MHYIASKALFHPLFETKIAGRRGRLIPMKGPRLGDSGGITRGTTPAHQTPLTHIGGLARPEAEPTCAQPAPESWDLPPAQPPAPTPPPLRSPRGGGREFGARPSLPPAAHARHPATRSEKSVTPKP